MPRPIRSYIQPSTMVGVFKYINPNDEILHDTKRLHPLDSSLQKLNPRNDDYNIILADPEFCEGMMIWIINSSSETGILKIYDNSENDIITDVLPNTIVQCMCVSGVWGTYTVGTYTPSMHTNYYTKDEIDALVSEKMDLFRKKENSYSKTDCQNLYYTKSEILDLLNDLIFT